MTDDGIGYTGRPPLTLADVTTLLEQIEAGKQRVLCASDMFEQVRDAVYGGGFGLYYTVLEHPYLQNGQVVMMQSEAEQQADLERAGREMMNSMFPALPERFSDLPWIIQSDPSKES